jgi:two-component system KDP operon response regulator KdpE
MNATLPKLAVLVVDDEVQIRRLLRLTLESAGYEVREADSGQLGLGEVAFRRPDAVILDLGLPDLPGLDVLARLREWSQVPVLILSVRGQESDKVAALVAGADDYLTKPFGVDELLARITALLRRSRAAPPAAAVGPLTFGNVTIDLDAQLVVKAGEPVHLTPTEFALLRELALAAGRLLPHAVLLRKVWGPGYETETEYTRVYIRRLRAKLEDPDGPPLIATEPRAGYRMLPDPD